MEGRRNDGYIDDQARPQRRRTDDGYLKAKHANNDTRADDDYLNPKHVDNQTRPDSDYLKPKPTTRPDNGYLELGNVTNENRPDDDYVEIGHMNNQNIGNSGQYAIIDYNLLNTHVPIQDNYTYRGLKFDAQNKTRKCTTRQHPSDKVEEHKKSGHRVFILIIVALAVLLVAMAATFGVLYTGGFFDKYGSSDKQFDDVTEQTSPASPTSPTSPATTTEGVPIEERCQSYDGLIPHPSECQAYYNCSDTKVPLPPTNFEPFLNECPYPQLFSIRTMACEHFENVDCGERLEAKDGCDYREIPCSIVPCIPCSIRYPRCRGKMDGVNMHDDKPWSPYYIICYKERFVTELICPHDPRAAINTQYFSPEYDGCVSLERIPQEHGGYKPNCTGKEDGRHPNNYGRCNHYTICAFGQYVGFEACPDGTAFDEVTKTCTSDPYVCECTNNC